MLLPAAGFGAEAAIGQLTRLTSLHLSFHWRATEKAPQLSCKAKFRACAPLQLQLLGCDRAVSTAGGDGGGGGADCSSSVGSRPAASRNTGLQELRLSCCNWLSDDELAAAAAAMPDLRRLSVTCNDSPSQLRGLSGAGLAAFTACRRLRHTELPYCGDLQGQQLVAQLPQLTALTSVRLNKRPELPWTAASSYSMTVTELQAAFQAEHGRHVQVDIIAASV